MSGPGPYLTDNTKHTQATHWRWLERVNRDLDDPGWKDEWGLQQCGGCRYFIPLIGALKHDWGACTNPASPFDRQVMFEHDGCDQCVIARDGWFAGSVPSDDTPLDS